MKTIYPKDIDLLLSQYTIKNLCKYLGIHRQTYYDWRLAGKPIPKKYHRMIVEYFEINGDDVIDYIQNIQL